MEMLRSDDELFAGFGQAYLTSAYPGAVKAWHYHKVQVDNFVVVRGMMKVVLYDDRLKSLTCGQLNEYFLGEHNPLLLQIPAGVYHGMKCISESEALLVNLPTQAYNHDKPDEYRLPAHTRNVPYDWARVDR